LGQCEERKLFKSVEDYDQARTESMDKRCNPAFILRNYLMEEAIKQAEDKDDFS